MWTSLSPTWHHLVGTVFALASISASVLHAQDAGRVVSKYGGYGGLGLARQVSAEEEKLAEIELKLESVLELLPQALPDEDLQAERQMLVAFFDRLSARIVGNTPQPISSNDNPLKGKVVIINPSSISMPHEHARIEEIAGKKFVVYPVQPDEGDAYESWTAIDTISRMRVFMNMDDARASLKQQKDR